MADSSNGERFDSSRAELFEVLGHPVRIRILESLEGGPLGFSDLKRRAGLESSGNLQFHLGKLGDMVSVTPEGNYTLSDEGREALRVVASAGAARQGKVEARGRGKIIISRAVLAALIAGLIIISSVAVYQEYLLSGGSVATALDRVWSKTTPLFIDGGGIADQSRFYGIEYLSINETYTGPQQGIYETFRLDAFSLTDGATSWQASVTFRNYIRTFPHLFLLGDDVCLMALARSANVSGLADYSSVSLIALRYNASDGALIQSDNIPMTTTAGIGDFMVNGNDEIYAAYVAVGGMMSVAAYGLRSGYVGNLSVGGGNGCGSGDDSAFVTPHHLIVADGWSQQAFVVDADTWNLTWSGRLPGFVTGTRGAVIGETLYYLVPFGSRLNLYGMDFSQGQPTQVVNASLSLSLGAHSPSFGVDSLGGEMLLCSADPFYEAVSATGNALWSTTLPVPSSDTVEGIDHFQSVLFPDGRVLLSYIDTSTTASDFQTIALVDSLTGRTVLNVPWPSWRWPWESAPSFSYPLAVSGNLLVLEQGQSLLCVDTSKAP